MRVSIVLRTLCTSSSVGGVARSVSSSASIACSSSSAVWPGRAVATIWKYDPSFSDSCCAETLCAI